MWNAITRCGRYGALLGVVISVLLSGCKQELYGSLTEQDANEMVASLLMSGIDASKTPSSDGKAWSLDVDDSQFVQAVQILHERGLPETKFDSLGDLFKKDGLISTPAEERVRFIYGTSQELSETLSKIDGVLVARVQIVLPDNDPLAPTSKPSSAAVFIKYRTGADVHAWVPQIKTLVMHSVEGLTYDEVSVITVPADPVDISTWDKSTPDRYLWLRRIAELVLVIGSIALFITAQRGLSFNFRLAVRNNALASDTVTRVPEANDPSMAKRSSLGAIKSVIERLRNKRSKT